MKRTLLSFLIILCTALAVQAQPAPVYTLKSCLEQGLLNNYSLRITRNEQQVSKNNATLANAGYLPTLDLSAGYKGTLDNTETKLRATGEREVPSKMIGNLVMEELKGLDKVAYIRFASVYRSFEDIREFGEEIARLEK